MRVRWPVRQPPARRPRWYQLLFGTAPGRRRAGYRPWLEALEDRTVPGFLAPVNFPTDSRPQAVAVADVNWDGVPDLVVANGAGNDVSVLLGSGNGTFQPARNFATGSYPISVAVADLTGDGKPDLVTSNLTGSNVSVLLGNGDGTFQPAHNISVGNN